MRQGNKTISESAGGYQTKCAPQRAPLSQDRHSLNLKGNMKISTPSDTYQVGVIKEYEGKLIWHFVFDPPKDLEDAKRIYKEHRKRYPKNLVRIFIRKHFEVEQ